MNERMQKMLNHPATIPSVVGVVSFGFGIGVGYILGRRRKAEPYEIERVEWGLTKEELVDLEEETAILDQLEDDEDHASSGEAFVEKILKEREAIDDKPKLDEEVEPEQEIEVISQNVFAGTDDEWNYDAEVAKRTTTAPYVLHKDEFYDEELGYSQWTVTWYEGDEILADQESVPIYNPSDVIGPLLWGHGSGDPNVFHVRNDKLKSEYEVLRDEGHFSVEVMGYDMENEHQTKDVRHSSAPGKFKVE